MVRKLDQVLPSKLCLANKKALVNKNTVLRFCMGGSVMFSIRTGNHRS